MVKVPKINDFDFLFQETLNGKYDVIKRLGQGYEGEVFLLREKETGIERAGKFFYPHRNIRNSSCKFYAKKLHKLRNCDIIIQYHTQETLFYEGLPITFLVSEFVKGKKLSEFVARQPGKHLTPFEALHLLYALAQGLEPIHRLREYHGDLHTDNIMIERYGLNFELKVLDFFRWKSPRPENINDDIVFLIQVFYEVLGGERLYSKQPPEIKEIICGQKRTLILRKFRTAGQLRHYLENMEIERLG